jgi:hypothetical protein
VNYDTFIPRRAAEAEAWLRARHDTRAGLDNGERLYGNDAVLLAAYRRGQALSHGSVIRPAFA